MKHKYFAANQNTDLYNGPLHSICYIYYVVTKYVCNFLGPSYDKQFENALLKLYI